MISSPQLLSDLFSRLQRKSLLHHSIHKNALDTWFFSVVVPEADCGAIDPGNNLSNLKSDWIAFFFQVSACSFTPNAITMRLVELLKNNLLCVSKHEFWFRSLFGF